MLHPLDTRRGKDPEKELAHDGRDNHRISAGKVSLDRRGAAQLNDRQISREHRLQGQRAPGNTYRLDVESILFVIVPFLGKPHRHLGRRR